MQVASDGRVHIQAWRALLRAHAALTDQLERDLMAGSELPLSWFEVLLTLDEAPDGRMRLQQLVDCALMTKSGVSRLIDRMETAGLVRRESCPADRRGAYAVITETGRERLRRAAPAHERGLDAHFSRHLSSAEAQQLRDTLGGIADRISRTRGCGD